VIRAGGSHPTKSTQRLHACTHQGRALASAAQAGTAKRPIKQAGCIHKPGQWHAQNKHNLCIQSHAYASRHAKRMHRASMKQAEAKHVQDKHKTCRQSHAHARAETTKRMHKTSMKHAEYLHASTQYASVHIPLISRRRYPPQDAVLKQRTNFDLYLTHYPLPAQTLCS
jgi:hypothetical protein